MHDFETRRSTLTFMGEASKRALACALLGQQIILDWIITEDGYTETPESPWYGTSRGYFPTGLRPGLDGEAFSPEPDDAMWVEFFPHQDIQGKGPRLAPDQTAFPFYFCELKRIRTISEVTRQW